jgi:hypothetical protein
MSDKVARVGRRSIAGAAQGALGLDASLAGNPAAIRAVP